MSHSSEESLAGLGRSWRVLVAALAASILASLDLFVVNLAFSSIASSYPAASAPALSWVLNAYGVAFAALLVPAGRLAQRMGTVSILRVGFGAFSLGSAIAAIAPNVGYLVAGRAIQGIGAALVVPTSLALLLEREPLDTHRQLVALWSAAGSIAAAVGPALGGLLAEVSWKWIFVINIPIAGLALAMLHGVNSQRDREAPIPDVLGIAVFATAIGALITSFLHLEEYGPLSYRTWALFSMSLVLFAWFGRRCTTSSAPVFQVRVFRVRIFLFSTLGMLAFYVGFAIMLLGVSTFLTEVWSWRPLTAGIGFFVGPASAVISALVAGRTSLPAHVLATVGSACFIAAGLGWALWLDHDSSYFPVMFAGLVVTGVGAGVAQTGFLSAGVSALRNSDHATGAGILNTARQIGAAIGVAICVTAISGSGRDGYHLAWIAIAALGGAAAAIALRLRSAVKTEVET